MRSLVAGQVITLVSSNDLPYSRPANPTDKKVTTSVGAKNVKIAAAVSRTRDLLIVGVSTDLLIKCSNQLSYSGRRT